MANSDITIGLSKEVRAFMQTRVIGCFAVKCKNNLANDVECRSAECALKHVYILDNGICEQYIEKTATEP